MRLISQVNGDGDIIEAWLRYYQAAGVEEFLIILHGEDSANERLLDLVGRYPITIVDRYRTQYSPHEKCARQNAVLRRLKSQWVIVVDSDEFVEFPCATLKDTIWWMRRLFVRALSAPMLQRTTRQGTLESPEVVHDVDAEFPMCVPGLYRALGSDATETKFPLFFSGTSAAIRDGGNHVPPVPMRQVMPPLRGVTHHFKWRPIVRSRLEARINSRHPWKHQSEAYLSYLVEHGWTLPIDAGFEYSRQALKDRGLLVTPNAGSVLRYFGRAAAARLGVGAQPAR